jgi:hypothetical protein
MNRFAFLLLVVTCSVAVLGQRFQPLTGPVPRTADGKPDLNGVWEHPFVPDMTKDIPNQKGEPQLPFTEWGANEWKTYDPANGDYTGACLPYGLPRSINSPYPIQILQTPKFVGLLFEQSTWFHAVPIGGRGHRQQDPTWFGDSVGRWEGDTLVIDTVNVNGHTRLDTAGHPHSDQLHLVQRFTRTDLGHMTYEMIVDDPKTYTKTWKNTRTFIFRPDWELIEYSCEENNKGLWEGHIKAPKF